MTKRKKNSNKSEERIVYFIDTSYLLEYFKVSTKNYTEESAGEIKRRIKTIMEMDLETDRQSLFIPVSCIFELGNHIGDLEDDKKKKELKQEILIFIKKCQEREYPILITSDDNILNLCDKFQKCPKKGFSLTDTSIKETAESFKNKHKKDYKVHILTRDKALKDTEPDPEDNPFVQSDYVRGKSNCHK